MAVKKIAVKKIAVNKKVDALEARAQGLKKSELVRLSFDPIEAKRACRAGLTVLEARLPLLKKRYPAFDLAGVRGLLELCDRVIASQREVDRARVGSNSSNVRLAEVARWRRRLLPLAQSLVETGRFSEGALKRIVAGRGPSDQLQDVLELAELLAPHAGLVDQIMGQGALRTAAAEARGALAMLGVLPGDQAAVAAASERRDRYATLVQELHDLLRVGVAVVTSYREGGTLVPGLSAGRPGPRRGEVEPGAPALVATPG